MSEMFGSDLEPRGIPSVWSALHTRFKKLAEKTGREKSSSYVMNVIFSPDGEGEVSVELGTYDIASWPRHLFLGPFKTEAEAIKAASEKISEAERWVAETSCPHTKVPWVKSQYSDERVQIGACPDCGVILQELD